MIKMDFDPSIFKIKTGILGLDKICGGGINRSNIVAITGPTGAGKTIMAMEFIVRGTELYEEPGLYISFGGHKDSLYIQMQSFGWELEEMERNKQMVFIEYPINEIEQFLSQNSVVTELIDAMGIERVVIDSIGHIAEHYKKSNPGDMMKFFDNIRKWGCTTLLIDENLDGLGFPKSKHGVESIADGWFNIEMPYDKEKGRQRYLEVIKLKGSIHDNKKYRFEITENGIVFPEIEKKSKRKI